MRSEKVFQFLIIIKYLLSEILRYKPSGFRSYDFMASIGNAKRVEGPRKMINPGPLVRGFRRGPVQRRKLPAWGRRAILVGHVTAMHALYGIPIPSSFTCIRNSAFHCNFRDITVTHWRLMDPGLIFIALQYVVHSSSHILTRIWVQID